jgi:hypothetical protein
MAMACGTYGNARCEIKELVAIHVLDPKALALIHHKGIRASVRR